MASMRPVFNDDERRTMPWTTYPFAISNSARYEPSCPVMPVMSAVFGISGPDHVEAGVARHDVARVDDQFRRRVQLRIGELRMRGRDQHRIVIRELLGCARDGTEVDVVLASAPRGRHERIAVRHDRAALLQQFDELERWRFAVV